MTLAEIMALLDDLEEEKGKSVLEAQTTKNTNRPLAKVMGDKNG